MKLGLCAFWVAIAISITGCATAQTFKAYEGPERPQDELAILDWSSGGWVDSIDGKSDPRFARGLLVAPYDAIRRAELLPGKHTIKYTDYFYKLGYRNGEGVIDMKPGHVYILKHDRSYPFRPKEGAAWIEDQTTGEVVLGSKVLY